MYIHFIRIYKLYLYRELKTYLKDGQLEIIVNYIDGKENGKYKQYYTNGQLCVIFNYINDMINGKYKEYL